MLKLNKPWFKILTLLLLVYTCIYGLLGPVPRLPVLHETIRVLYFHVPMWFGMVILLTVSMVYGIRYLRNGDEQLDDMSLSFAKTGIVFGVLGLLTGMVWANYTWGTPWHGDPKQTAAAIAMLIYFAYLVLRNSIEDQQRKARVSAVYNVFAYAALIPLLFILPRLTSSMHPGSGGNPGFNTYDLDSNMRLVFYPAVLGWTFLGIWISLLTFRFRRLYSERMKKIYES
jgi:heme exporter protein C